MFAESPTKGVKSSYSSQSLPGALQLPGGQIRIGSIRKAGTAAFNRIRGHGTADDSDPDIDRVRQHYYIFRAMIQPMCQNFKEIFIKTLKKPVFYQIRLHE